MRSRLSILWLFATLNYLYCDVVTLMDGHVLNGFLAGNIGGVEITQGFLLAASALVEIPISMVVLSRFLNYPAVRWANVAAGAVMTVVQVASLFARTPAPYYVFFSAIEIACTVAIVGIALRWKSDEPAGLRAVRLRDDPVAT